MDAPGDENSPVGPVQFDLPPSGSRGRLDLGTARPASHCGEVTVVAELHQCGPDRRVDDAGSAGRDATSRIEGIEQQGAHLGPPTGSPGLEQAELGVRTESAACLVQVRQIAGQHGQGHIGKRRVFHDDRGRGADGRHRPDAPSRHGAHGRRRAAHDCPDVVAATGAEAATEGAVAVAAAEPVTAAEAPDVVAGVAEVPAVVATVCCWACTAMTPPMPITAAVAVTPIATVARRMRTSASSRDLAARSGWGF